jgi:hypothetical protein
VISRCDISGLRTPDLRVGSSQRYDDLQPLDAIIERTDVSDRVFVVRPTSSAWRGEDLSLTVVAEFVDAQPAQSMRVELSWDDVLEGASNNGPVSPSEFQRWIDRCD